MCVSNIAMLNKQQVLSFSFSMHMCMLSRVQLLAILWTVALQAPQSIGFLRQKYWCGLPLSPPGDLLNPGIELESPESPALAGRFFTTEPSGRPSVSKRKSKTDKKALNGKVQLLHFPASASRGKASAGLRHPQDQPCS